ncbi:MAG: hypothetical protein R2911_06005 [Caldilineaceae bacterium]
MASLAVMNPTFRWKTAQPTAVPTWALFAAAVDWAKSCTATAATPTPTPGGPTPTPGGPLVITKYCVGRSLSRQPDHEAPTTGRPPGVMMGCSTPPLAMATFVAAPNGRWGWPRSAASRQTLPASTLRVTLPSR